MRLSWGALTLVAVCGLAIATLLFNLPAEAGGPLFVGAGSAGFGQDGVPFTWDLSGVASPLVSGGQIQYRTDGGNLGVRSNTDANNSVEAMFNIWENVATSNIEFNRAGGLLSTGVFTDGNVSTAAEFNAVEGSCGAATQNPIVYDADGTLFSQLGQPTGVIGFAGACSITTSSASPGRIVSAEAALNGNFRDGDFGDGVELTDNEFDAVFIHEFGHLFGLDHSQINQNCLASQGGCADFSDDSFGLPTMFPFLISGLEETAGVHPARTLSTDDIAWVSRLYPDNPAFNNSFGTITGTILYSDGSTHGQGFNVIARQVDNGGTPGVNESRRIAASVVSGYLFTACAGNNVVPGNCGQLSSFGSRNTTLIGFYSIPVPPGSYTVEIEGINPAFTGGSGVGPIADLGFQFPLPGPAEFFNFGESNSDNPADSSAVVVSAGGTVSNINVIVNGTAPGLDAFEPNTSVGNAAAIGNGTTPNLSVSPFGNEDFYSFGVVANTTATFEIFALRLSPSSFLDSVMEIVDSGGTRQNLCRPLGSGGSFNQACLNDDLPGTLDSGLEFRSPGGGTFFVHILDFRGDGRPELRYSLSVSGTVNPVPSLNSLSPNSATAGGAGFTLTVNGLNFASDAVVQWNGSERTTTFINPTQLQATIPASDIAVAGSANVTAFNPAPGGGPSNGLPFTVNNPVPAVSTLFPDIIPATSPQFTLTVNGAGFVSSSVVRWNCTTSACNRATTVLSSTQLQATILATDVANVGTAQVRVFNPEPGGGHSRAATFTINLRNPLPTVTGLTPPGVVAGASGFLLGVSGSNFVFNSQVQWDGIPRDTTFLGSGRLQALIPATDLEVADIGTHQVTVVSPGPGGGSSNSKAFSVQNVGNPMPMTSGLVPDMIVAGTERDTLPVMVNGTDFVDGASVARWNGSNRLTTFNNPNQLTAMIPASDLVAAGTAQVTVFTAAPGGGISNAQTFTINNPLPATSALLPSSAVAGSPGLTLVVTGSSFAPGSVVRWNCLDSSCNRPTTFIGNSQLRATIPASDLASASMATVTVFTPAPGGGTSNGQTFAINPMMAASTSDEGTPTPHATSSSSDTAAATEQPAGADEQPVAADLPAATVIQSATAILRTETLEPRTIVAGSAEFTLTVRGEGFAPGAMVRWNGEELATKFVSRSELEAVVPARHVAAAGSARIAVSYPELGVESQPKIFTITPR